MPLGRFGTPEEAASAALFVMANAYVTGTVLTVDGGASLA
ncbi:SDR family oxidoreductase [Nonomuraea dietziae]|nr:SDR family oxidoreductase [Nonomuraea dietziae]